MAALHNVVHKNEEVLRIWDMCVNDASDVDEQRSLLLDIIKEWTTLRGKYGTGEVQKEKSCYYTKETNFTKGLERQNK